MSPSPRRAWIEMSMRSPQRLHGGASPSPRRAWIEIHLRQRIRVHQGVALPAEGVDRNIQQTFEATPLSGSPSPRRAWIEMTVDNGGAYAPEVALPAEGVDRNGVSISDKTVQVPVALPAEGVDRNPIRSSRLSGLSVALPAEGVDRNSCAVLRSGAVQWSPSPRRAWIEMRVSPALLQAAGGRPPRGGRG